MTHRKTSAIIFAALIFSNLVQGQTVRGVIAGTVTDASQRPLADAKVSVTQQETNRRRETITDAQGQFTIPDEAPGAYKMEVERDGYARYERDFVLLVNQELHVDVPLPAGTRSDTVRVTATREVLQTESAAVATVIENRQITNLPLDGRNFLELSLLAPGAAPAAPGSAESVRGDVAFSVNGTREDANSFLLDGVFNGDPKLNTFGVVPPVDGIREFQILTSVYDASFGHNAGGQVSVVMKSGSNQIHGSAYEFFRNKAMDARNFFAPADQPSPRYQRNQFGGSLGGPIRKNRTFFFADYEGNRSREGITRVSNVPTLAERQGDFTGDAPVINPFTQSPFPNNQIPAAFQNPVGAAIAALYPAPNRNVPFQNYVSSPVQRDRDDHFDARADHSFRPSDELTFRYSFSDRNLFEPFTGSGFALVPGYGDTVPRRAQNVMLSETHIFTPKLLNEFRAAFSRLAAGVLQQNQGTNVNQSLGLPTLSTNPRDTGMSLIQVTGYSPLGDEYNNPQHSVSNVFQITDHATYARGRHLFKFGADIRSIQQNAFRDVQSRGFVDFLGLTGNALAELLLGIVSVSGGATVDNAEHLRYQSYQFFGEDTFRVRRDLTLNLGLRYEYNTPPVDAQNRASIFDVATQSLIPAGWGSVPRSGFNSDRNNFAPRIGLAWSPGNRSRVFRAGYGIYYDQSALATGEGLYFNPPYFNFQLYFPLGPTAPLFVNDPFPKNFPVPYPQSALAFQRDLRTAYVQQWSFNIQQEIGKGRVAEIGYVGTKGTRLLNARDINQPAASPQQPNLRPNPQFADIDILESRGNSIYHSLQARVEQRLSHGLSLLATYVWSKAIDDGSNFFPSTGDPNFPQNSYDLRAERGLSNFDVRHRLTAAYSYDIPLARGHRWLGGWQTNGILSFQTGRPFTVALLSNFDNSNTGQAILGFGANDRPNVVGNGKLSSPSPDLWFNTAAFVIPPFGSFGNSGRNILEGPGLETMNLSLVKNTRLTESATVQFRAETFNALNHPNFDLPDIFVGSPTFGKVLSAGSPRHIQFGLKFLF